MSIEELGVFYMQIVLFTVLGGWLSCAVVCYWIVNSATSCIWWLPLAWLKCVQHARFKNCNVFGLLFEWLKMYIFYIQRQKLEKQHQCLN